MSQHNNQGPINERGGQEGQNQIRRCNNKSRGQSDMFAVLKMGEGHELRYQQLL